MEFRPVKFFDLYLSLSICLYLYLSISISLSIINLKTLLKTKEELKRIKVTFISELAGKICGELKDFCPKKLLLSQAIELTVWNLEGRCNPPDEVNVEINVS